MKEEIVEYLKTKYSPKCIILHGSRVNGQNRPNSDWDLLLIGTSGGRTELYKGQSLDVETLTGFPEPKDFIKTHGSILRRNELLFDDANKSGQKFIDQMNVVLAAGKVLSETEYENRFLRMSRVLDKMSGSLDSPELFFLHAGVFGELALRFWFELKGQWSEPPYIGLPYLKNADPEYFKMFTQLSSNQDTGIRCQNAFNIYKELFPKRYTEHPSLHELMKL